MGAIVVEAGRIKVKVGRLTKPPRRQALAAMERTAAWR